MERDAGIEPATTNLEGWRFTQVSYHEKQYPPKYPAFVATSTGLFVTLPTERLRGSAEIVALVPDLIPALMIGGGYGYQPYT